MKTKCEVLVVRYTEVEGMICPIICSKRAPVRFGTQKLASEWIKENALKNNLIPVYDGSDIIVQLFRK